MATVWFLVVHIISANGPAVIPAPYPTKAACISAAMEPQQGGHIWRFVCVPAYQTQPKPSE